MKIREYFGYDRADLNRVGLLKFKHDEMQKYVFDQLITEENLDKYLNDYEQGKLLPLIRSEPVP